MTLNGTPILLPEWHKHKRLKKKNAKLRSSYRQQNCRFFKPASSISNLTLHNWCYDSCQDFTQLPRLLNSLNGTQQFHEWNHQSTAQSVVNRLNVFQCGLENNADQCKHGHSFENTPLVWDTGASLGLTPYRADFFDYVDVSIPVRDVTKTNYVVGIGTVIYRFQNDRGDDVFLPCIAYHLPTADIRLFSPQSYHQMHGQHSTVSGNQIVMHLKDHNVVIPIDSGPSNLPMVWNSSVSAEEKREIGLNFISRLEFCGLSGVDSMFQFPSSQSMLNVVHESFDDVWDNIICPCVGTEDNANLSGPQKELLTWHWKLGISMG